MRTLITGGTGFIGSHLVHKLVDAGDEVVVFAHYNGRGSAGWLDHMIFRHKISVFFGDISDIDSIRPAVLGTDRIFHLASLISVPYSYYADSSFVHTNILGTLNLLKATKGMDTRILHVSTSEVYGTALTERMDESHPLNAQSPYAATKIAADQMALAYARSHGLRVRIARPFNTYGPRQSTRAVIPSIIVQALAGQIITVGNKYAFRDLTFVEDTVNGMITVDERGEDGQVYNIGTGETVSVEKLIRVVGSLLDNHLVIRELDDRKRPEHSEVFRLCADASKIKKLGWMPHWSLSNGLDETIRWHELHPRSLDAGFI